MSLYEDEDRQYQAEVQAVQNWWTDSRWRYTKRPYTAEQIVAKRGNLKIEYPSNSQSKKLWGIVENNFQVRTYNGLHGENGRGTNNRRKNKPAPPMAALTPP